MKVLALVFGLLLMAAPAFAADVDGSWSGGITTPNGDVQVAFTFTSKGAMLSGTTTGPDGSEVAIKDGKVDGNNISFTVSLDFGGMPIDLVYKGIVTPAQIDMIIDFMGMPIELMVKKVPPAGAK
jgi:hypothetical protein